MARLPWLLPCKVRLLAWRLPLLLRRGRRWQQLLRESCCGCLVCLLRLLLGEKLRLLSGLWEVWLGLLRELPWNLCW